MENIRLVPLKNIMKELYENRFICEVTVDKKDDIDILILESILNNKILPSIIFDDNKDRKTILKGSYMLSSIHRCLFSEETEYFYDIKNERIVHYNTNNDNMIISLYIFTNSLYFRKYVKINLKHIDEDDKCFDVADKIGSNINNFNLIVIDNSSKDNIKQYTEISNYLK